MGSRSTSVGQANTVSLFSGLGGLDLGAALAGLSVGIATDHNREALSILFAGLASPTLAASSDELTASDLLKAGAMKAGQVRYLIGGPPCTAFSHAGFWLDRKREGDDPAAGCLNDYLRLLGELAPQAFLLENVPGLQFKTHRRFFDAFVEASEAKGYAVTSEILCASDFGVPQRRRRLFIVGVRDAPPFVFPRPVLDIPRTTGWAMSDLENRSDLSESDEERLGKYAELLPMIPPGGNYLHFTEPRGCEKPLFRYRGRYWSFLLKLDPKAPSPTVPAQRVTHNGPFHWANRHLRVPEIARLQLFPDWYPLDANHDRARIQLGNAVPPLMAAFVIWTLRAHLGDADTQDVPSALRIACDSTASVGEVMSSMNVRFETPRGARARRPDGGVRRRTTPMPPARASSSSARAVMIGNARADTRPERALRSHLHKRGLRFRINERPVAGMRCEADIVLRGPKVAVFVDGCFWHGCPDHNKKPRTNASYWAAKIARNVERDRANDERLRAAGWIVLRCWEHEPADIAAARVAAAVSARRARVIA